jgi:hypothetical protein
VGSRKYLTRADIAIGRLAMQHKLLSREQLEECTTALDAEASSGASTSLAQVLVKLGYVSEEEVEHLAETAGEKTRVRRGTSRIERPPSGVFRQARLHPVKPAAAPAPASEAEDRPSPDAGEEREARLRKITSEIAGDRICPELLEHIIRKKLSILNAQSLATAMGESRDRIVGVLRRWIQAGVLRSVGDYPYCYSPTEQRKQDIREFLEAWRDEVMRTRLLSYILSQK